MQVEHYPNYIQIALDGNGARYFSGSWDETTLAPPGFMTPHQISAAAYVPLVKVYTLSGNSWYEIPEANWVDENGEPNPYQAVDKRFLLSIEEAVPYVEAFRKYRAYRRDRFGGGLPPEMHSLSDKELKPIRDYILHMKAKEQAGWAGEGPGFGTSALGSDYVKPKPFIETVTRKNVARAWNFEQNRVETMDEAYERVISKTKAKTTEISEPPLPVPMPINEKVLTPFKRGWNRFYRATGDLPEEVNKLTVKWNGFLRVRLKEDHVDDFGELVGIDVNGFGLTLKRHRSGKYYEVKVDAPTMKAVVEYKE